MKCAIGHEIKTETGFKVFEAGLDYPADETEGREKYFEQVKGAAPPIGTADDKPPDPETDKTPRRGRKHSEEVEL